MPSDKRVLWYNLHFNRYALQTGWNECALCFRYYQGLPDRLRNAITAVGKPKSLERMKALAIKWDQRYWEQYNEKKKNSDQEKKQQKLSGSDSGNNNKSSLSPNNNNQKQDRPKQQQK